MFAPKEILQNLLMAFGPVRKLAIRRHRTGINSDPKIVQETYDRFASCESVAGRRILELGPGQTLELLALAKQHGAAACSAVDVVPYADPARAASMGIDYRIYGGGALPYADGSFDLVWAWDVLEHLRHPQQTLAQVRRVLAPGGAFICRVDLRDHYHLDDEDHWLDCLKYSAAKWNAMTWFRSSYVNRLRVSQWEDAFGWAGFSHVELQPCSSERLVELQGRCKSLQKFSPRDVSTWKFEAVAR